MRRNPQPADRQHRGRDETLIQRPHDRAIRAELHEVHADNRGHDARRADRKRIDHQRQQVRLTGKQDRRQNHGRDDRHCVRFEQVGRHARAVADVIAHVVGDGGRVTRIVFRNTSLHLADEIAADIRTLGEDAAAKTSEDRDE